MVALLASRAPCAAPRAAPRAAPHAPRCISAAVAPARASALAPRAARASGARRTSRLHTGASRTAQDKPSAAAACLGEGSGVEETWSPVASRDPLVDTADELVAADNVETDPAARNIMVTLDGGEASYRALDWALEHLARKKDTVHLVNVIPLDATYSPFNFSPVAIAVTSGSLPQLDPDLRRLAEERGKAVLEKGAAAVHAAGRTCVAHLIVERTWETVSHAVCAKAEELSATALVVANSGKNWAKEMLAGSLTNYLIHHAPIPVVSIPPHDRPHATDAATAPMV